MSHKDEEEDGDDAVDTDADESDEGRKEGQLICTFYALQFDIQFFKTTKLFNFV